MSPISQVMQTVTSDMTHWWRQHDGCCCWCNEWRHGGCANDV